MVQNFKMLFIEFIILLLFYFALNYFTKIKIKNNSLRLILCLLTSTSLFEKINIGNKVQGHLKG